MKRFTYFLLSTVFLASFDRLAAASPITIDPTDADQDFAGNHAVKLIVNDLSGNNEGGAVTFTGNNTGEIEIIKGRVKTGAAGKLTTGPIVVKNGGELELTDDAANLVPGQVEVQLGGKIKVGAGKTVPQKTTSYLLWADGLHDIDNPGDAAVTGGGTFTPGSLKLAVFDDGGILDGVSAAINSTTGAISFSDSYGADASGYYDGDNDNVTSFGGGDLGGFSESGGTITVDGFDDLPAGVTINNANGSVDFSGVSGGDYHVNGNGYYNVASGQELSTPSGFSISSGAMSVTTMPTLALGFSLESGGTISLPSGYSVDASGTYQSSADDVKTPEGFIYSGGNLVLDPLTTAGSADNSKKGFPVGTTIAADGTVTIPGAYTLSGNDIVRLISTSGDVGDIPAGFDRVGGTLIEGVLVGGSLQLAAVNPALPLGTTLAADGTVTLLTGWFAVADNSIHKHNYTSFPTGTSYDSGNMVLTVFANLPTGSLTGSSINPSTGVVTLPAEYTADGDYMYGVTLYTSAFSYSGGNMVVTNFGNLPLGSSIDGSGVVTLPGGSSVSGGGGEIRTHNYTDPTASGFSFGSGVWSLTNFSTYKSSLTSIDASFDVNSDGSVALPTGWSYDGQRFYNNVGAASNAIPGPGFTVTPSSFSSGLGSFSMGDTVTSDVFTRNLHVKAGAIIELGAGSRLERDLTVE